MRVCLKALFRVVTACGSLKKNLYFRGVSPYLLCIVQWSVIWVYPHPSRRISKCVYDFISRLTRTPHRLYPFHCPEEIHYSSKDDQQNSASRP